MIFTSTDPVPAPSIHDANHIDSVRIRLHHLMTSSDLSTNPASEHLWKSIDQITNRLSSLASFMPPGSTPGNHYRVLLLYICRILLLFTKIGKLTGAPDDFHRKLETLGVALRQEMQLKDEVKKYTHPFSPWTFEHAVDIFSCDFQVEWPFWRSRNLRKAMREVKRCVQKVEKVGQLMECGVGCRLWYVVRSKGVLYVAGV